MGRDAKLRQKNGYWYSEAGGVSRYYGKVGETTFREATRRLRVALLEDGPKGIKVRELFVEFKKWIADNRAHRTAYERCRQLKSWIESYGDLPAGRIGPEHLVEWQTMLFDLGYDLDYVRKHIVSVKMMFGFGIRSKLLKANYPFNDVEQLKAQVKRPSEESLLQHDEIEAIFRWADTDLGTPGCKRFSQESRTGSSNPWAGFEDLLRVYHATGARTHELAVACVRDFSARGRQIILPTHKRSLTLKQDVVRAIYLNDVALAIVEARCRGRDGSLPIFTRPLNEKQRKPDQPWHTERLNWRFRTVRELAGVRDSITIYSFRHLWISDMVMEGVDLLLVARMAGTSVNMIEKVYGHFRASTFQDAQSKLDAARCKK